MFNDIVNPANLCLQLFSNLKRVIRTSDKHPPYLNEWGVIVDERMSLGRLQKSPFRGFGQVTGTHSGVVMNGVEYIANLSNLIFYQLLKSYCKRLTNSTLRFSILPASLVLFEAGA